MSWNKCPLCEYDLYQYKSGNIKCNNEHYTLSLSTKDNKISIYSESIYIGHYCLYRCIDFDRAEVFILEKYGKYICDLDIVLSPKITEEYIDKLLLFS